MFQVEAIEISDDPKEQGQRILEWVSPDEAARRVREVELKALLVEFEVRGRTQRDPR
ncbi:MutT/NUDIX family hydrolase [Rhizobium sp. CCGE 510]|nr:MutT/NUDIX family hydrolase [Rhizobium sp. CCGE 510]